MILLTLIMMVIIIIIILLMIIIDRNDEEEECAVGKRRDTVVVYLINIIVILLTLIMMVIIIIMILLMIIIDKNYEEEKCAVGIEKRNSRCVPDLDFNDGQFSEQCDVDASFFNSDAILIIFWKGLTSPSLRLFFLTIGNDFFSDYFAHLEDRLFCDYSRYARSARSGQKEKILH